MGCSPWPRQPAPSRRIWGSRFRFLAVPRGKRRFPLSIAVPSAGAAGGERRPAAPALQDGAGTHGSAVPAARRPLRHGTRAGDRPPAGNRRSAVPSAAVERPPRRQQRPRWEQRQRLKIGSPGPPALGTGDAAACLLLAGRLRTRSMTESRVKREYERPGCSSGSVTGSSAAVLRHGAGRELAVANEAEVPPRRRGEGAVLPAP